MIIILLVVPSLFILYCLIDEWSTADTIGSRFVSDKSIPIIKEALEEARINPYCHQIISVCNHKISCINDSCRSIRSRYYMITHDGYWRVKRGSKAESVVKEAFKKLKPEEPEF